MLGLLQLQVRSAQPRVRVMYCIVLIHEQMKYEVIRYEILIKACFKILKD